MSSPNPRSKNYQNVSGWEGLQTPEAFSYQSKVVSSNDYYDFLLRLHQQVEENLQTVLLKRENDWEFIRSCGQELHAQTQGKRLPLLHPEYPTVIGRKNEQGEIVIGFQPEVDSSLPMSERFWRIPNLPAYLRSFHAVWESEASDLATCLSAMNVWHQNEENSFELMNKLVEMSETSPKWLIPSQGKTCSGDLLHVLEGKISSEEYPEWQSQEDRLSHPIRKIPEIAQVDDRYRYEGEFLPAHLCQFVNHLLHFWSIPKALCFYLCGIENEVEASYWKTVIEAAEKMIQEENPEYVVGSIKVFCVLDNARAPFRLDEILWQLQPYCVGTITDWQEYYSSARSIFPEPSGYLLPSSNYDAVMRLKELHSLQKEILDRRGGLSLGCFYSPLEEDIDDEERMTDYVGFLFTQIKRGLNGFWVSDWSLLRPGIALVEAWDVYFEQPQILEEVIRYLVVDKEKQKEYLDSIEEYDIEEYPKDDVRYNRALLGLR